MSDGIKWKAVIVYRTDSGPVDIEHDLSEIEELDDIIERGPHFDTLIECKITRVNPHYASLTVESEKQLR